MNNDSVNHLSPEPINPMMNDLLEQSIIYDLPSMVVPYDFITQFLFKSMNLDETIKTFFNLLHREASKYLDTSIEEEKKYGV